MVRVYDELDEVKAGIEKLREECRAKTELCGSLKKAHVELAAKLQEARLEIERQTKELCVKSKEIFEVRQLYEEIKSILHEKESFLQSLSSANQKLRVDYCEKVGKLEGENKELVLALDEATTKIQELERKVCASDKEINALKETLSVIKEKGIEAQLNVQASRELKEANEVIQKLEEDNRIAQDQLKWKNEQFTYLEEVHRRLHDNFQTSKAEWGKEKSDLLEEISSLQTSLDSQIRISQDLETQLRLCNQALAHEESRRKVLEVEVSDFKSRCDDILLECQETKSKHEHLTLKRDEEIGELRNLLRTKETLFKEMKLRASQLEQDKLDLCASLIPRKSKFAAFEFTAEDERVEKDSRITLCKFKKRKSPQKHSPINKYTFLKSFDRGVKNTLNEFVDELVDTGSSNGPMDVGIIKSPTVVSSGFSGCKPSEHNRTEYHGSEFSSLATTTSSARLSGIVTDDKHVCSPPPLIPADNEPVVVDSNDDPVIELRLPKSASIAQLQGLPDEHALKYSSNVHETEALVVVIPDHIIYRNIWSTRSCLEFSPKCIRLDALPISETRPLTYKWKVSAIVDIQSVWIDSIKTADVMVRLISKTQRSRAVRILRFAVCDPDWSDRQEAIQSLDFRYKDRWRTAGVETVGSELFLGQERFSPSSTSFPILEAESTEHEANRIQSYVQKEEQAAVRPEHLPEIIEVSGSDTGEDKGECLVTSTAESAAYIVEDSEEDEDNVEGSMNRVQPLLRSKPRWKTEMDDECGLIAKLKMVES